MPARVLSRPKPRKRQSYSSLFQGCVVTLMLDLHLPHSESSAVFSDDGRYRYRLTRRWAAGPALMFISHNPSTAGARRNDATVRRDIGFARAFGYNSFTALNLYAGRATDPKDLAEMDDPIGPDNDDYLDAAAAEHDVIVFAWGTNADPARARSVATRIWRICRATGGTVAVLDWTLGGQPRHPLYMRSDTQLQCLTARAHVDMLDADPRWTQLLADAAVLDDVDDTTRQVRR
jgi:hypothetical protein